MERIFLSFHYDDAGKRLANQVERLVKAHGLRVETGERLGGAVLGQEITKRIDESDALISLLTERTEDRNNNWVRDERTYAHGRDKPTIAVLQKGVDDGGLFQAHERIDYDPDEPVSAIIRVAETIGLWRQRSGRIIPVQIEPKEAAQFALDKQEFAKIEYRFWNVGEASDWRKANPFPKAGGVLAYLRGVPDGHEIQLRIDDGNTSWSSEVESQTLRIPLKKA